MWLWMTAAYAEQCAPSPLPEQTLDVADVRALAVRSVAGVLTIVPAPEGAPLRLRGTACGDLSLSLSQNGEVAELLVRPRKGGEGASLVLSVPPGIEALTVHELAGALYASDLPLALAVISSVGPVEVSGVDSLRVAYVKG